MHDNFYQIYYVGRQLFTVSFDVIDMKEINFTWTIEKFICTDVPFDLIFFLVYSYCMIQTRIKFLISSHPLNQQHIWNYIPDLSL